MSIEYVHASALGTTVAIVPVEGGLGIAMAFSHKESPSGRRNFEQFSRAKGRSITAARAAAAANGANPPYTALVETGVDARAAIKVVGNFLHDLIDNAGDTPVQRRRSAQFNNNILFNTIVDIIGELS